MRWLAETVHTGTWANDWFDVILEFEDLADFIEAIGRTIVKMFAL